MKYGPCPTQNTETILVVPVTTLKTAQYEGANSKSLSGLGRLALHFRLG